MKRLLLYLFILFFFINFQMTAQETEEENSFEQVIQEFIFSESVYLQEKNEVQMTATGSHFEMDQEMTNSLGFEVEYGIVDWFQLSTGYTYEHVNAEGIPYDSGWFEVAAMVRIFNSPLQAAAFSFEAEFPVNKPHVEEMEVEDEAAYTPSLIYAREFGDIQVHLNVGTEIQQEEMNWFYNAAAVYGKGNWHPVLELNGNSEEEETEWFGGAGLVVNNENGWELGGGISHGISSSQWMVSLHVIYEFNLSESED